MLGAGAITSSEERRFAQKMGFDMLVGPANMASNPSWGSDELPFAQSDEHFVAPAILTPTEFQNSLTGAFRPDAITVFPASTYGPEGLKRMLTPFARKERQGTMIIPMDGVDHETGPLYAKAIAVNGFTPVLGMSAPLWQIEAKREPGNVNLIGQSIRAFNWQFVANNGNEPFGAIKY